MVKRKLKIEEGKEEAIKEAKRFLKNAKEILSKVKIEYGRYTDTNYVSKASEIAYLAALKAIDGYLIGKGFKPDELPKSIEEYFKVISEIPRNSKLKAYFSTAYENLYLFGYRYKGGSVKAIRSGLKSVEEILKIAEG